MLDKEGTGDEESTVIVDTIVGVPETTVGAAIKVMEEKLAGKGINLQFPPFAPKSERAKVDGELLRLPMLIQIGITHGIDTTDDATEQSIGKKLAPSALVPGSIVALYSHRNGSFLRVFGEVADLGGGNREINKLPLKWDSERFLVVDGGNGNVAFYSPSHRRFLSYAKEDLSASGFPIVNVNESPRANETFQIADVSGGCYFQLRCPIEGDKLMPSSPDDLQAVQICGFD